MELSQPASGLEGLCMREKTIVSLSPGNLSASIFLMAVELCPAVCWLLSVLVKMNPLTKSRQV